MWASERSGGAAASGAVRLGGRLNREMLINELIKDKGKQTGEMATHVLRPARTVFHAFPLEAHCAAGV